MMRIYKEMLGRFGKLEGRAKIILYGSVASGKSRPDSDVDLAVITDDKRARAEAGKIADGIFLDYGKAVLIAYFTPEEMKSKSYDPFVKEVGRGQVLYG